MIEKEIIRNPNVRERNAIEQIVKHKNLDRAAFHEVNKFDYQKIIRKIYYTFFDYEKYPQIQLAYMWTRYRTGLSASEAICEKDFLCWKDYIDSIDTLIEPDDKAVYYLLIDTGWVYEGTLQGIKDVLCDYPEYMEDFYIVPRDYSWIICHCDDGECMVKSN